MTMPADLSRLAEMTLPADATDAEIVAQEYARGKTLREIGREWGFSHEWARIKVNEATGNRAAELRRITLARAKRQTERMCGAQALEWSRQNPGRHQAELAEEKGWTPSQTRQYLGERANLHPNGHRRSHRRFSDQELLDAVAEHYRRTGDPSAASFRDRGAGQISLPTVVGRFGTWRAAAQAAGIPASVTGTRVGHGARFTDEQCIQALVEAIGATGQITHGPLERWIGEQDGMPSLALIRKRFGTYSAARQIALERIAATRDAAA